MKASFILGAMIGVAATSAVCASTSAKCVRRAKRMFVNKLEDVFS